MFPSSVTPGNIISMWSARRPNWKRGRGRRRQRHRRNRNRYCDGRGRQPTAPTRLLCQGEQCPTRASTTSFSGPRTCPAAEPSHSARYVWRTTCLRRCTFEHRRCNIRCGYGTARSLYLLVRTLVLLRGGNQRCIQSQRLNCRRSWPRRRLWTLVTAVTAAMYVAYLLMTRILRVIHPGYKLSSDAPEDTSNALAVTGTYTHPERVRLVNSRRQVAGKRVLVWLLFGAIFGLFPLFAVALKEVLSPGGFHIDSILASGDLFIISAVLSAGALGELIAASSKELELMVILAGFFCFVCFAGNTLAFAFAGAAKPSQIITLCAWFFPATLIASASCVGRAAY